MVGQWIVRVGAAAPAAMLAAFNSAVASGQAILTVRTDRDAWR